MLLSTPMTAIIFYANLFTGLALERRLLQRTVLHVEGFFDLKRDVRMMCRKDQKWGRLCSISYVLPFVNGSDLLHRTD